MMWPGADPDVRQLLTGQGTRSPPQEGPTTIVSTYSMGLTFALSLSLYIYIYI